MGWKAVIGHREPVEKYKEFIATSVEACAEGKRSFGVETNSCDCPNALMGFADRANMKPRRVKRPALCCSYREFT